MSDCVLWTGGVFSLSYGAIQLEGRTYGAHRVFYMLYNGPIPRGHVVHHTCANKLCVNPEHLEAITQGEHMRLHRPHPGTHTYCKRGHPFTPGNTRTDAASGKRRCITCQRTYHREWQRMKRQLSALPLENEERDCA